MLRIETVVVIIDFMERLSKRSVIAANLLALSALNACSGGIDSYHTDPSDVHCDDGRTKVDLIGDGSTKFIVHGEKDTGPAVITIRRRDNQVSVKSEGNVTGPPQTVDAHGYTPPAPIEEGAELAAFGANAAWIIDVQEESVVIQGSCEGM